MSSESGLNAAPSTPITVPASDPPASSRARSTIRARHRVDRVHLTQERRRLPRARLIGAGQERAYVLGQAASADPDPDPDPDPEPEPGRGNAALALAVECGDVLSRFAAFGLGFMSALQR